MSEENINKDGSMKTGIIGFFDILGYRSFLHNSSPECSEKIVDFMANLKDNSKDFMMKSLSPDKIDKSKERFLDLVNILVFSDTILLYVEFDDGTDNQIPIKYNLMHMFVLYLWKSLFEFGLPLRGVIHKGEFMVKNECFAGKAIVEAYDLAQDLDLAVAAYSTEALNDFIKSVKQSNNTDTWNVLLSHIFPYLAPRKREQQEQIFVFNPYAIRSPKFSEEGELNRDIRQYIMNSFLMHNKVISVSAQSKVNNTEDYFRTGLFHHLHPEGVNNILEALKKDI